MIVATPGTDPDVLELHLKFRECELPTLFLGGSIDQDRAERWQDRVAGWLSGRAVGIFNPRRGDWDASWAQDPSFGSPFWRQVTWELDAQERADVRLYYFADSSSAPITLLELGLFGPAMRTAVRCTPAFYRYGNVKMFCDRYGVKLFESDEELRETLEAAFELLQ